MASVVPIVLNLADSTQTIKLPVIGDMVSHLTVHCKEALCRSVVLISIAGLFIIKNLLIYLISSYAINTGFKVSAGLSSRLLDRYFAESYLGYLNRKPHEIVHVIQSMPLQFVARVWTPIINLSADFFILSLGLLALLLSSPGALAYLGLLFAPAVLGFYLLMRKYSTKLGEAINEHRPKTFQWLSNIIAGFTDISLYNVKQHFGKTYLQELSSTNDVLSKDAKLKLLPQRIMESVAILGLVALLLTYAGKSDSSDLLLQLTIFAALSYKMIPALNRISSGLVSLRTGRDALEKLNSGLQHHSKSTISPKGILLRSRLEIRDLSFHYSKENLVLNDINVRLQKGDFIGLKGKSGFGKTTLAKVLVGFLSPQKGTIKVNGEQVGSLHCSDWQRQFAWVDQSTLLLDATLRENLEFGTPLSSKKMQAALDAAGLSWDINSSKPIGTDGNQLSQGQKMRLALARAIAHNKDILILDEVTSSLDYATESLVVGHIKDLCQQGKTVILISHRSESLAHCTSIWEMTEDGRLLT